METVESIFKNAKVDIQDDEIVDVRRLGQQEGSRPILVSFVNEKFKAKVFQKAKNFKDLHINFANDMTRELRERKKMQYLKLQNVKTLLEQQGREVFIKGSFLIMDNERFDLFSIQKFLPAE